MKIRHNKKRNTAFVYEALVREATAAILKEDAERKDKTIETFFCMSIRCPLCTCLDDRI